MELDRMEGGVETGCDWLWELHIWASIVWEKGHLCKWHKYLKINTVHLKE